MLKYLCVEQGEIQMDIRSNHIDSSFKCGKNLKIGYNVIIESDVIIGNNVKIGHRVTLKSGTRIGDDSIIDDHCITTGACYIGNNVNIRTGAIISRATVIEDYVFIGPGVITNHTKNITHGRPKIQKTELLTYIGYGSIIGSQASLLAGIKIDPQVIVGGGSVVVNDLEEMSIYVGSPCKKLSSLPEHYKIKLPINAGKMYATDEVLNHLTEYMKHLIIREI